MPLETDLRHALAALPIAASRLFLTTPGVAATVPMIRGVFGVALRTEDETAYQQVFVGGDTPWNRLPTYLMRPAGNDIADPPALEFLRFGHALRHEHAFERAWRRAGAMGLGKTRRPFTLRRIDHLGANGAIGPAAPWQADQIPWPLSPGAPCRLVFPAPLRLLGHKRLITAPTLADLIGHGLRRLAALAGAAGTCLAALEPACRGAAEATTRHALARPATRLRALFRRAKTGSGAARRNRLTRPTAWPRAFVAPARHFGMDPSRQGNRLRPRPDGDRPMARNHGMTCETDAVGRATPTVLAAISHQSRVNSHILWPWEIL